MIEKLRKKFILVTMIAVISVFAVIIFGINGLFFYHTVNNLNSITKAIVNSDGHLRHPPNEGVRNKFNNTEFWNENIPERFKIGPFKNKEMPFATRYFFAVLDNEMNILELNTDNIASVDTNEAETIINDIIEKGNETGWKSIRRYRLSEIEKGYMIVVLDAENQVKMLFSLLGITLLVSVVSITILFILIRLASKKVIRPIAESYEKQRQFITNAGHELKTPLTAVSANMEMIKMTSGETKWTDAVDRQTDKMTKLINQLIRLSKMDEEVISHEFSDFSLSEAVFDTVEAFRSVAENKKIKIKMNIQPDIHITHNEADIRQLTSILVDNAMKYCDIRGETIISLHNQNHSFGKNKAILTIQNDFKEIEHFEPDKVFDRFYRGDKAHIPNGSFGLGLSIAKSIADSYGIKLNAEKNSTVVKFTVSI